MKLKDNIKKCIIWIKACMYNSPFILESKESLNISQDGEMGVTSILYLNDNSFVKAVAGGYIIYNDGKKEYKILEINGCQDWRGLWKDSIGNVFASPHSTPSLGEIVPDYRGIYKLDKEQKSFYKVLSLYDKTSVDKQVQEINDDTIWTFCEDDKHNLYAGVYAHTIRPNPSIYKSCDGGDTWNKIFNFRDTGLCPTGKHIHSIVFSESDKALYALVGEVNTLYRSIDGGYSWVDLQVHCENAKGCSMLPVEDGIIIGSDDAYECLMSKYYFKTGKIKTKGVTIAGTIFSLRKSDKTDWIYAFDKIDSSVVVNNYYPPIEALFDKSILKAWFASKPLYRYRWLSYFFKMRNKYFDDCVRPQHCFLLRSKDAGESWELVFKLKTTSKGPNGFWTTGYFRNGERVTGFVGTSLRFEAPFRIKED